MIRNQSCGKCKHIKECFPLEDIANGYVYGGYNCCLFEDKNIEDNDEDDNENNDEEPNF